MLTIEIVSAAVVALGIGLAAGLFMRKVRVAGRVDSAEARAQKLVSVAEMEAENRVRLALVVVKDEIGAMRRQAEEDLRTRRQELRRNEERFERGEQQAETRHAELERREKELARIARELQAMRQEIDRAGAETRKELERVSQMTAQEAREGLVKQIVGDAKRDAMSTVREIEQQAREEGENRARKIVTIAIQRVASDLTSE
jgi:ribonucrease Y